MFDRVLNTPLYFSVLQNTAFYMPFGNLGVGSRSSDRVFNTPLELCDLFAPVLVWDSLNILTIINYNNVLNILLKIETNSLKQHIAA